MSLANTPEPEEQEPTAGQTVRAPVATPDTVMISLALGWLKRQGAAGGVLSLWLVSVFAPGMGDTEPEPEPAPVVDIAAELAPTTAAITQLDADVGRLDTRVVALESLTPKVAQAHEFAVMALRLSVETNRHLEDLIIDVAHLDHPDYKPLREEPALERHLRQSEDLLDTVGVSP